MSEPREFQGMGRATLIELCLRLRTKLRSERAADLGELLKCHGRWDIRSPDDKYGWRAFPEYSPNVMGVGSTLLLAVQDALAQMVGYPKGVMTRKVDGKCRGCGAAMHEMIAECDLGFFFRKCKRCNHGNFVDVTDGEVTFQ